MTASVRVLRRLAVAVAAASVLMLAPTTASALGATKYCGIIKAFGGSDVALTGGAKCKTARSIAKASSSLPPVGNGPGSPDGWQCARITGAPPTGLECTREGSTVSWFDAPSGARTKRRTCSGDSIYSRTGVGQIKTRGIACGIAINVIVLWDEQLPAKNGPVGYGYRRSVVGANEPGELTRYSCRRGKRRMTFAVGG